MKAGFVSIFGRPNAGKSTLLNAIMGEKLAIVSHKVQTTRHRIKAILTEDDYQIVFSDTPGIIDPKYRLHQKMMQAVKSGLEDADVALLVTDASKNIVEDLDLFDTLHLKAPAVLLLNKTDLIKDEELKQKISLAEARPYIRKVMSISALKKQGIKEVLDAVLPFIPEGEKFYEGDDLSDLPMKFFVSEIIREKVFELYHEELPYQTTVLVQSFKEKQTLVKIMADIIVQRETQKAIILGQGGKMIRELGTLARKEIESFIGQKVFLELFVKVRPKWRDTELYLKEYGY